jgi:hypothetical protein
MGAFLLQALVACFLGTMEWLVSYQSATEVPADHAVSTDKCSLASAVVCCEVDVGNPVDIWQAATMPKIVIACVNVNILIASRTLGASNNN